SEVRGESLGVVGLTVRGYRGCFRRRGAEERRREGRRIGRRDRVAVGRLWRATVKGRGRRDGTGGGYSGTGSPMGRTGRGRDGATVCGYCCFGEGELRRR
ncbi:hypothetical protein HAX54_048802, partial [Datura stramonium]|nr:hypothetical protein [Datura stramonium]